ncbi:TonB-linked outer membrane protein, SusC/RagA family [Arachidicoccus rhizosphaerae]|uniref:TonB-linked outer membrane protein, SusC/RagA family n=1 Tax=Arachidicoccus rhizosphaerae TaxID=551991 RepID=A0A1H4AYE9_9BACT|nr:TonB-dependent receptor [Arachidicoccus rhizosphaerae]SEA40900.1 TonB-linked outer membrane protein, SusC/RagA family [Arachidicoccus rhizosphaerae]
MLRSVSSIGRRQLLLSIKLVLSLIFVAALEASGRVRSQNITCSFEDAPLKTVLSTIKEQSGYVFFYKAGTLDKSKPVTLHVRAVGIQEVLKQCFENQPLGYQIEDKTILIVARKSVATTAIGSQIFMQQQQIEGIVTDSTGHPIGGVSVLLKGTSQGTITDAEGRYLIMAKKGDVLIFNYVGYETEQLMVGESTQLNVTLHSKPTALNDVVIVGYGTTTREKLIGAVDQVTNKNIENRPVGNLTQALQGQAPSLLIQQKSMDPNNNAININIRGLNTKTNASPLVVIDGMISDINNMNSLNPNDIDKISILKDAGTAAIYGSRSASGVILITTKHGAKNMAPNIKLGASGGVQTADILYHPVEGWQNATLLNVALTNGGNSPAFTPEQIQDLKDHKDAPWMMDYIFKNAAQQRYDASVSGGSAASSYNVSGSYFGQGSNFIGPGYGIQRYTLRTNYTTEYKRLKLNVILGYVRNDGKGDQANAGFKIADASRTPKYYYNNPLSDDGRYIVSSVGTNTAAALELGGYNKHNNDWVNVGTALDFTITNDLKARGVFGYDLNSNWNFVRNLQYPTYNSIESTEPVLNNTTRNTENYSSKNVYINAQFLLDYNKNFGKHEIAAMAGVSQEVVNNKSMQVITEFTDPDLGTPVSEGDNQTTFDNSRTQVNGTLKRVIQSVFGRLDYSYDRKYSAEFTIRSDGSTRFPKENQWGVFPSLSLGWRVSEEPFMQSYKDNVGSLKLRGSWGILGNQEIADYQYFTTYTVYSNVVGFDNTIYSGTGFQIGSPDLKWEKVNTRNIGADLGFFNDRLTVNLDYFYNKTNDILLSPITPSVLGTTLGDVNIGSMENRGWEVTFNYQFKTGEVSHSASFNIGNTQNKALDLGNPQIRVIDNVGFIQQNGLPLGAYYGLKTDGLFQSKEEIANSAIPVGVSPQPGDVKYVDRNGDGIIDDNDRQYLGDGFPHYNFGLNYSLNYKGFDFAVLIQGVGKRLQSLRGDIFMPFHNGAWYPVIFQHELDTWTVTNTDARYPRLTTDNSSSFSNNWGRPSDAVLLNAKYIRVKNIQLGYTLPGKLTGKWGLKSVRAFINMQNPFTFSPNSFIDPESTEFDNLLNSSGGNSGRNYPTLKFYGGGININF